MQTTQTRKFPRPLTEEDGRRLKVYDECASDSEASKRLGLPYMTFSMWRNRLNLKAKGRPGRKQIQTNPQIKGDAGGSAGSLAD